VRRRTGHTLAPSVEPLEMLNQGAYSKDGKSNDHGMRNVLAMIAA
jgi:hypothetical protein